MRLLLALLCCAAFGQQVDYYRQLKNGPVFSNGYRFQIGAATIVSGSLATAGTKTLTLKNTPAGVYGASTNHKLRISGGVGTAENVLITGGTCSALLTTTCTIQFTTANTHTGSWIISSATCGHMEAHRANPTATNINSDHGTCVLYATSTFSAGMALAGKGDAATFFTLNDPTMDAFVGTTWLNATDMRINSGSAWQTAGAVFKVPAPGRVQVQNVYTNHTYNSIDAIVVSASDSWFENCVNHALYKPFSNDYGVMRVSNIYADGRYYVSGSGVHSSTVTVVGSVVTRTAGSTFTGLSAGGLVIIGGAFGYIASVDGPNQITMQSAPTPGVGVAFTALGELLAPALIHIEGTMAGGTFENLWFQASQASVVVKSYTANPTNELVFGTSIFDHDSPSVAAISVFNNDLTAAGSANSIRFNNIYINNGYGYGVLGQYIENFAVSNSKIQVSGTFPPISLTSVLNTEFKGNKIFQQPLSNTPYCISLGGTSDKITFEGNDCNLDTDGVKAMIVADTGITNLRVKGNSVFGGTGLLSTALDAANLVAKGNSSAQAKREIQVTATDTLIIPAEDESTVIQVNGGGTSSTVATMTGGYNGRQVLLYFNTAITVTATNNILTAFSAASGSMHVATYDAGTSKWIIL